MMSMKKRVMMILGVCFFGGILPIVGILSALSMGFIVTENAIAAASFIMLAGLMLVIVSLLGLLILFLSSKIKNYTDQND